MPPPSLPGQIPAPSRQAAGRVVPGKNLAQKKEPIGQINIHTRFEDKITLKEYEKDKNLVEADPDGTFKFNEEQTFLKEERKAQVDQRIKEKNDFKETLNEVLNDKGF